MGSEVFPCPKCSRLNTTNWTTCKNCGANLQQFLDSINAKNRSTLILDIIVIVAVLGLIMVASNPRPGCGLSSWDEDRMYAARGIESAIRATIQAKHSDYLINAVSYTMVDVLTGTSFSGGLAYSAAVGAPGLGEVTVVTANTTIGTNIKGDVFRWTWTAPAGDTPALMTEDSTSAFP